MTDLEYYKIYLALRLHFTSDSYDIVKTRGAIKVSPTSLDKNPKLKYSIQKLKNKYKKEAFIDFCVGNFIKGDKWGGIFYSESAEENYLERLKTKEGIEYLFKKDIRAILDSEKSIDSCFEVKNRSHPKIMKLCLSKSIKLETAVILNRIYNFTEKIDQVMTDDPIWNDFSKMIKKYAPFVKADKTKFTTTTTELIGEYE